MKKLLVIATMLVGMTAIAQEQYTAKCWAMEYVYDLSDYGLPTDTFQIITQFCDVDSSIAFNWSLDMYEVYRDWLVDSLSADTIKYGQIVKDLQSHDDLVADSVVMIWYWPYEINYSFK